MLKRLNPVIFKGGGMKMGCFMFSAVFWGVIVVVIGLSIISNAFGIKIPIMKIMLGLLFVYMGMSMLTSGFGCKAKCKSFMSDLKVDPSDAKEGEYSVIFGKGEVDLTALLPKQNGEAVKVKTIFGESHIKIDPLKPFRIKIKAVFAGASTPDGNVVSFGEYTYNTEAAKNSENVISVEVSTVFGGVKITDK